MLEQWNEGGKKRKENRPDGEEKKKKHQVFEFNLRLHFSRIIIMKKKAKKAKETTGKLRVLGLPLSKSRLAPKHLRKDGKESPVITKLQHCSTVNLLDEVLHKKERKRKKKKREQPLKQIFLFIKAFSLV